MARALFRQNRRQEQPRAINGPQLGNTMHVSLTCTLGPRDPYISAGINCTMVLKTQDEDVASLQANSAWDTVPALGNPPACAIIKLDSAINSVGVSYRL